MQFLYTNWMLVLIMFMSGIMLLYPLIQRRTSGMAEVGNVRLTHLLNREDAAVLDIREAKDLGSKKIIGAIHVPLSQLKDRALRSRSTRANRSWCTTLAASAR